MEWEEKTEKNKSTGCVSDTSHTIFKACTNICLSKSAFFKVLIVINREILEKTSRML